MKKNTYLSKVRAKFNNDCLKHDSDDNDTPEDWVGEQALEDVQFVLEEASVEFIKDLHQHKSIEDNSSVLFFFKKK